MSPSFWNRLQRSNPRAVLLFAMSFLLISVVWWTDSLSSPLEAVVPPPPIPADPPAADPVPLLAVTAFRPVQDIMPRNPFASAFLDDAIRLRNLNAMAPESPMAFRDAGPYPFEWMPDFDSGFDRVPGPDPAEATPLDPRQIEVFYRGMLHRTDNTRVAFLDNLTDGAAGYYRAGESIGDYRVQTIQPRAVTLRTDDGLNYTIPLNHSTILGRDAP